MKSDDAVRMSDINHNHVTYKGLTVLLSRVPFLSRMEGDNSESFFGSEIRKLIWRTEELRHRG